MLPLWTLLTPDELLPLWPLLTSGGWCRCGRCLRRLFVGRKQRACGDRQLARRPPQRAAKGLLGLVPVPLSCCGGIGLIKKLPRILL